MTNYEIEIKNEVRGSARQNKNVPTYYNVNQSLKRVFGDDLTDTESLRSSFEMCHDFNDLVIDELDCYLHNEDILYCETLISEDNETYYSDEDCVSSHLYGMFEPESYPQGPDAGFIGSDYGEFNMDYINDPDVDYMVKLAKKKKSNNFIVFYRVLYYIFLQFTFPHTIDELNYSCMEDHCLCDVCINKYRAQSEINGYTFQYRVIYKQSSPISHMLHRFTSYYSPKDQEDMIKYMGKLVEDSVFFVRIATDPLKDGHSRLDQILFAFMIFAKMRHQGLLLNIIKEQYLPFLQSFLKEPESIQSFEAGVHSMREAFQKAQSIKESAFTKKMEKCLMFILSFSLLDRVGITMDTLGYSKVEQAARKRKYSDRSNFFMTAIDTMLFIMERGIQVYKTGDPQTIFHSEAEYQKIYDKCNDLKYKEKLLVNPEAHGFTECEFRSDLDDIIEKLSSIIKYSAGLTRYERDIVKHKLSEMKMMHADLTTKKEGRKNRDAPFGIAIFSPPGMGKTSLTKMISTFLCRIRNLPLGDEYFYTRNPVDDFWSGFVSSVHTLILDDVASENPDLKDPKSVNEIIQVMNNAAFCPNQAELEMKGRTPLRVKNVIATTNVIDFNAYSFFAVPSAVQRRFPFIIIPTVKPEYLSDRGILDSSKVNPSGFPDLWTFTVKKVVCKKMSTKAELRSLATLVPILEDVEQREFFSWLRDTVIAFEEEQKKIKESMNLTVNTRFCSCCNLPESMCFNAQEIQSNIINSMSYGDMFCGTISCFIFFYCRELILIYTYVKYFMGLANNIDKVRLFSACTKRKFISMGKKVMNKLGHPQIFIVVAVTIGSIAGILFYTRKKGPEETQGGISTNIGTTPEVEVDGRENVWYKNEMELTDLDLTRESLSSKSTTFEEFQKRICRNVIRIETDLPDGNQFIPGYATCLGGQIYITNNHNIPEFITTEMRIFNMVDKDGVNNNQKFKLSHVDVKRFPEHDVAVLYLRHLPPRRNISNLFMKRCIGKFNGVYIKNNKGKMEINEVRNIGFYPKHPYNISLSGDFDSFIGYPREETVVGDCGMPLLLKSEYGYSIGGIHVAANNTHNTSFALALNVDKIMEYMKTDTFLKVQSGPKDLLSSKSVQRELGPLNKKSVFRYIPSGVASIYGSFTGFRGKGKSRVENTPMSYFLSNHGYNIKYFKPEMKSWEPWNIAATKMVSKKADIDTRILDLCVDSYIKDVEQNMKDPDNIKMCMVLDDFTAINGAQVAFIDKMNRNTSAGNPWKKSKKHFMTSANAQHGMLDPVDVDDEIMERVVSIIDRAKNLEQSHPNFCAHLKDEPVSLKKAKMKKTRVFTGAPMDYIIVARKFCLGFIRLVQTERIAFEAAPGTIAQSLEWQELFNFITQFGEKRIAAGDFVGYDTSMVPPEIIAAFKVIYHFSVKSGNFTQEELNVIAVLAMDTAFALVDYNGDLVMFHGINPSGNPLTVILNSIVNSLRNRYVYYVLSPDNDLSTFRSNVALITYGDDNIMGISEDAPWFNHTTIMEAYSQINIEYTMADKETKSVPYIDMKTADFLKRKWRFEPELECHVAPLHHDSIEKMLMVWTRSKSVPEECQAMSVISSAMSEYFFYGRKTFEEKRELLMNMVHELDWDIYVEESTFPTWEELVLRFKHCSKHSPLFSLYYK